MIMPHEDERNGTGLRVRLGLTLTLYSVLDLFVPRDIIWSGVYSGLLHRDVKFAVFTDPGLTVQLKRNACTQTKKGSCSTVDRLLNGQKRQRCFLCISVFR